MVSLKRKLFLLVLVIVAGIATYQLKTNAGQSSEAAPIDPSVPVRHPLWTRTLQSNADSTPAYLPHVLLGGGRRRDLVFVVAGNNTSNCNPGNPVRKATTYALDA